MSLDWQKFKQRLEAMKAELETALARVGRPNPQQPGDWEPTPVPNGEVAFHDEAAPEMEEQEEREATEVTLETELQNVLKALERITQGTYGRCEIGGEEIELDRLEAEPTARTCKQHLER